MTARRLAAVSDYQSFIAALRARQGELGISHDELDTMAGWAKGYVGKVFGDAQVKILGMVNLWAMLEVLGVQIVIEESAEALARMEKRWEYMAKTDRNRRRTHNHSRGISEGARRRLMRELGAAGGRARISKMSPKMRTKYQSRAAKIKWEKYRSAKRLGLKAPIGTSSPKTRPHPRRSADA